MKETIYHYTHAEAAVNIITSGYLKVSATERKLGIKPGLWLSLNKDWEPTATKQRVTISGKRIPMTFEEQHKSFGCVRFVVAFNKNKLCSWAKYKYVSKTDPIEYSWMEERGLELGANPSDWFVSFEDISIKNVLYIEWWGNNEWHQIEMKDFVEVISLRQEHNIS